MASIGASAHFAQLDEATYKKRIRAWSMYDWANSAFATTILAAVLPIYFSGVAGSTLPSESVATGYWSLGLSISLFIVAILSPILGTVSDVMRGKKLFLAIFAGLGIIGTALLILVGSGDWVLASVLAILGRVGFNGSITFYDALLAHVAKPEDQDRVSAVGFAFGYLGGGILLAINVAMIQVWGGEWGSRISFLSVAIWWLVFSIPLFVTVPEPPSASAHLEAGETVVGVSWARIMETIRDIRKYKELFRYLIAFLIYNDGIGTIIGVAAIYATELGFGTLETILALLLVQFVGVPFSLIFGRIADGGAKRRAISVAFILWNLVMLPLVAISGRFLLPASVTGVAPLPYETINGFVGQGSYEYGAPGTPIQLDGDWQTEIIPGSALRPTGIIGFLNDPIGSFQGPAQDASYARSETAGAQVVLPINGQEVEVVYSTGPDHGVWLVKVDGKLLLDEDGNAVVIDAYSPEPRYEVDETFKIDEPGQHEVVLVNTGQADPDSTGTVIQFRELSVEEPIRAGGFGVIGQILGILAAVQIVGLALAFVLGKPLFGKLAETIDTRRGIILALVMYSVVAVWGFFLDSTIEFWFLAFMVAIVQGGSQALSRSLYAAMSPSTKSGEFFGLYAIMEKFASLFGPLMFAIAGILLNDSRWGILSLILFFIVGIALLLTVNVEEGKRVAQEEDAALLGGAEASAPAK